MASTYSSFLQSPTTSHLADDASLHYITTTTSFNSATAIVKHLAAQAKQVVKKEERVLHTVEGSHTLFLETQATLQFENGGGAYLPGMDQNVLDEKQVTFPLLHVVNFTTDQKISTIRLHWDQATLLKQVEAIGRTGRNWPIRDGKAQIDAITSSLKAGGADLSASSNKTPLSPRHPNEVVISQHKRGDSKSANHRDPQDIFLPRDTNANAGASYDGPKLAPRASAKPAPRDYGELFAGEDSPRTAASKIRSPSPSKADGAFKSGAGKHHTGNRLFDENDASAAAAAGTSMISPERKKTLDQKYQHFSFGDGEDAPEVRPTSGSRNVKHQPTFSFEDFTTPLKYRQRARPDDEVHWGGEDPPSPPIRPIVHAPRKDADTHFVLSDDAPAEEKRQHPEANNRKLYHDPVTEDIGADGAVKASSTTTTNVNNARRGNDFGPHYTMTDKPEPTSTASAQSERPSSSRSGPRTDMESHWAFDDAPKERKIYKTAGDGMGGRKGGATGGAAGMYAQTEEPIKKIYKTAGDGMGGKKGSGRLWGFGDDSDPEAVEDARVRGRAARV